MEDFNLVVKTALPKVTGYPLKKWYKRWWGILLIVTLVYFLLTFLILLIFGQAEPASPTAVSVSQASKIEENFLFLHSQDDPFVGRPDAPVRIVEFGDFQCPYCFQSFPVVREILSIYKNDIYFIFRDFPVTEIHLDSLKAAMAANCALAQGKFWEMHDKLFINQDNLQTSALKRYALELSLNTEEFNQCLDEEKFSQEIAQDYTDGANLGVIGTPTFFINGYRVPGSVPLDIFIKLIESAKKESDNL